MPKDNEVDEKVVAWMLTRKRDGFIRAIYNVKPTDEQIAIAEYDGDVYVPLTYAATVAELRAEVEKSYEFELNVKAELARQALLAASAESRADAAERRVGELERRLSEVREIQRTNYGNGIGLHLEMILWAREYDALTGADPT